MKKTLWGAAVALILLIASIAQADGFIVIYPYPVPMPEPWPRPHPITPFPPVNPYNLNINYHRVNVDIQGQLALTRVDQEFENPFDVDLEGTYIFPLPAGAAVDRFSMKVDGKPLEGEMLSADEAAAEYRKLVNQAKDPAILEYVGRGAVRARIYPIPARGKKRVEISYAQLLPADGGVVKYVYPLDTERFSRDPIDDVDVNISLRADAAIANVFSPSHKLEIARPNDREAVARYHAAKVKPAQDLVLYYAFGAEGPGAALITHKTGGEDGYFMLVVTPPAAADIAPEPKEITLVVDISGSMAGDKLDQTKAALKYCLEHLNPGDYFNIVTFNETVTLFRERAVAAEAANVRAGLEFVDKVAAGGGTNIDGALSQALAAGSAQTGGPSMVLFLTDGKPTVGERNTADIVAHTATANGSAARIFSFGVGYDVKTELLDGLGAKSGGTAQYLEPGEDVNLAVVSFYNKVASPILGNPELTWDGAEPYDLYPARLPDLFAGTQLTLMGRYHGEIADARLTLTGTRAGRTETFRYDAAAIGTRTTENPFIEPLWATRKIGFLLEQIKLEGEDKELVDTVVSLSKRYGVPTPYTSYLVETTGTEVAGSAPGTWKGKSAGLSGGFGGLANGELSGAGRWADAAMDAETPAATYRAPASGEELSFRESRAIGSMKGAATAPAPYGAANVRYVAGKAFRYTGDGWRDIAADDNPKLGKREITFGSDEYFDLLEAEPNIAPYFALGETVEVVYKGMLYVVKI